MQTVNIHEAKTHFSRLIHSVLDGEEVIIAKAGEPLVRMMKIVPTKKKIIFGGMKGEGSIGDGFDDELPEDLLALFEGRDEDSH